MLGYTISGRYLFEVYALKEKGIARVIAAMDMDEKSRRLCRKRKKGLQKYQNSGRKLKKESSGRSIL